MNCPEFDQRFHELLDDRICPESDDQLVAHAEDCAKCQQTLAAFAAIQDGLAFLETPEVSADFTAGVLSEAQWLPRPASARTATVALIAVVAALLLIALIPALQSWWQPAMPTSRGRRLVGVPSNHCSLLAPNAAPTNDQSAPAPETAVRTGQDRPWLAQEFKLADSTILEDLSDLSDVSQRIESMDIPGVRPITSSLSVAFTLLRRALPGGKAEPSHKPHARLDCWSAYSQVG